MLHYHLHKKELKARQYVEEEKQRILENANAKHEKNEKKRAEMQHGTAHEKTREVTAASSKDTWANDCRLGRKAAVLKGLAQGFFLVNVQDAHDGKTPLIIASRWGEEQLVKALILRKADPTIVDNFGKSIITTNLY